MPLIAVGSGSGGGSAVTITRGWFSRRDLQCLPAVVQRRGDLALDDVNGDGIPDLVVGAGRAAGPRSRCSTAQTSGEEAAPVAAGRLLRVPPSFSGGVTLAVDDVNGDGIPDLVVGAGPGGGPEVKVFNGADLRQGSSTRRLADFFAGSRRRSAAG